jgi:DNA repair protein RadD
MDLRDYQIDAIEGARQKLREGNKSPLLICPTGGGKTVIASAIIESAVARDSRILFLAHRKELLDQTSKKLTLFGVEHGMVAAGQSTYLPAPVQVASVMTLIRRPGLLDRVDLIFVDEAHHVTTRNTYAKLMSWWPKAPVVGLTATPWRLDGHGLADIFDSHVIVRTPVELHADGWLVPVTGWRYQAPDLRGLKTKGGDYEQEALGKAVRDAKLFGSIIDEWRAHANGMRTVLFACNIQHSLALRDAFLSAGVAAEHLDGETPGTLRDQILSRLRSGETQVVCNVNVLTEGFDCPELECAILARPTLSTSLYLQMVGRVLRPSTGKTVARIHDHARCTQVHGHPYDERDWDPRKSDAPLSAKKKRAEGGATKSLTCDKCGAVNFRWPCANCGFEASPPSLPPTQTNATRVALGSGSATATPSGGRPSASELQRSWRLLTQADKHSFFQRMVAKHGVRKAKGVYRWRSGDTEWPRREWSEGVEGGVH